MTLARLTTLLLLVVSTPLFAEASIDYTVHGVSGAVKTNIENSLTKAKDALAKPYNENSVSLFFRRVPKRITHATEAYGYFHPTVRINNRHDIFITLGKPIRITTVHVKLDGDAKKDPAFQALLKHFPIQSGDILTIDQYDKAKQQLFDLASNRGYFNAAMTKHKIVVQRDQHAAIILMTFRSGKRAHFGLTRFSTQLLKLKFLKKFLHYQPDQPYEFNKISSSQVALSGANYFRQVVFTPKPDEAKDSNVPIDVTLLPRKRYQLKFGAGFGTDSGPRASIGFNVRRINRSGHKFHAQLQAAQKNSSLTAEYIIPGLDPANDHLSLSTAYGRFDQSTGTGNVAKAAVTYEMVRGPWSQQFALTYVNERYNIVSLPFTESTMLYPSYHLAYRHVAGEKFPTHGVSFTTMIAGTPKNIASHYGFIQTRADLKLLTTLGTSTRLLFRGAIGFTDIKEIKNLPFSMQFFTGGARSVRGYRYNSIGPGRNLFTASLEVQQHLYRDWYLATFFDAGNVTNDFPINHLFEGAGAGLVWISPVGEIEFTVANAINQPNHPWVFQFTMGPSL